MNMSNSPCTPCASIKRHVSLPVAYGAIMLASSAMNSVFVSFYLKLFMDVASVTPGWFYAGQVMFAMWNALNDPLFGWLSDTAGGHGAARRLRALQFGGPLWGAAFILLWFPWSVGSTSPLLSGLHFALSLCLYDGALTFVEVNHAALLSDMTSDPAVRASANAASAAGAALGALASYVAHLAWADGGALVHFQSYVVLLGVVAGSLVLGSGWALVSLLPPTPIQPAGGPSEGSPTQLPALQRKGVARVETAGASGAVLWCTTATLRLCSACLPGRRGKGQSTVQLGRYARFLAQLAGQPAFLVFTVVSTIQVFDCTFEKNFFGTFLTALAGGPGGLNQHAAAAVLTGSFILPHLATVALTPLVQARGVAAVLDYIFAARLVVLAAAACLGGGAHPLVAGGFLLTNRVMSECVCRSFPLVTADIVDADTAAHGRADSMGASIIGTSALISKLSQSAAPMVGFALLSSLRTQQGGGEREGANADMYGQSPESRTFMWRVLVLLPAVCVLAQTVLWRAYPLRGGKTAQHHEPPPRQLDSATAPSRPQSAQSRRNANRPASAASTPVAEQV